MNWLIKHSIAPHAGDRLATVRRVTFRLASAVCLALCMMMIAGGCRGGKKLKEHTEVSGTVRFNGTPLTGGRIGFFSAEGDPGTNAKIDLDGRYTIQAPVGDVTITVDNSMLKPGAAKGGGQRVGKQQGAGPRPGGEDPTEIKGTYVPIPETYKDPKNSGLTYTVKKGKNEHDVELTDKQ